MASSQAEKNDKKGAPDDVADIKSKLAMRMAFAGAMIVALLGGLALFDYYSAQPEHEVAAPPQFTEPVPVAKKLLTQPVTPAEPLVTPEVKPAEPEATSVPVDKNAPRVDAPPPPAVAARPTLPRSAAAPARAVNAASSAAPSAPVKASESKAPPAAAIPGPSERTESAVAAEAAPPTPPRLFSGYALQAGVFSDPRRAEELQARLAQEGVPATIEARVQVGPFKTRAEADAARLKLNALGIESVMLPPKGARR